MDLIPSFNVCVDKLIGRLKSFADGTSTVPMKKEFALFSVDAVSKVCSLD